MKLISFNEYKINQRRLLYSAQVCIQTFSRISVANLIHFEVGLIDFFSIFTNFIEEFMANLMRNTNPSLKGLVQSYYRHIAKKVFKFNASYFKMELA